MIASNLDPRDAAVITFDCYGTLIDWHGGARAALEAIPALASVDLDEFVAQRIPVELEVEHERYRPYDEVLALSVQRTAAHFNVALDDADGRAFADSIVAWRPFPDAPSFLRRLRALGTPLAILSNVTRASLAISVRRLGMEFDQLVTAEDVRSYKPDPPHWERLQSSRGIEPSSQLHVAASLPHDVRPATGLGVPAIWVNRLDEPLPPDLSPQLIVRNLEELAEIWELPPDSDDGQG